MSEHNDKKKRMSAEDAAAVLSDTLRDLADRKTTLRRATVVSRLALALARTIKVADLEARIEAIEQVIKKRK